MQSHVFRSSLLNCWHNFHSMQTLLLLSNFANAVSGTKFWPKVNWENFPVGTTYLSDSHVMGTTVLSTITTAGRNFAAWQPTTSHFETGSRGSEDHDQVNLSILWGLEQGHIVWVWKQHQNQAGAAVRQRAESPSCCQLCMSTFLSNAWSSANSTTLHRPERSLQNGGGRNRASSSTTDWADRAGEGESVL